MANLHLTGGCAWSGAFASLRAGNPRPELPRTFHLTRWFAGLSLVSITIVTAISAALLSSLFVETLLYRDAEVGMAFVQSLTRSADADSYFREPRGTTDAKRLEEFFERITTMPDVLRANVYAHDKTIIWSSNPDILGKRFDFNPELDGALEGHLKVEAEMLESRRYLKPEHVFFTGTANDFVENYIPVWDQHRQSVIGVVELYKEPRALYRTVRRGVRLIWLCAMAGGAFLFGALYWIVRRAHRLIGEQAVRLAANESFVAIGEMTAAVAHGIRNPLASIRSSAELMAEIHGPAGREQCAEIMEEVDRIEHGVRALVMHTQMADVPRSDINLNDIAHAAMREFSRDIKRQAIVVEWRLAKPLPNVVGDGPLLQQVFASLVANALQAMPNGGSLAVTTVRLPDRNEVAMSISDSGVGIPPEHLERLFVPFRSTKKHGLGVGLPLVRRVLQRFGGAITMTSNVGHGTTATLTLPAG